MRHTALLAAILWSIGGPARGEIRMIFDPDPSFEAQERAQAAFLDLLREPRDPPWLIDCITFDDVRAGSANGDAWEFLDAAWQWELAAAPSILSVADGPEAYSPPQSLGWPRGFDSPRRLALAFTRTVSAVGLWVIGDAREVPAATGRVTDAQGGVRDFSIPGCDDPAAPSRFFVGFAADEPIALVSIEGADVADSYAGIDHVWIAGTIPNTDIKAIRASWFRCETGDANDFLLERDGSPACDPDACPGLGDGCWGLPVIARAWSADGIAWRVAPDDAIRMTCAADTFVLADTWVPLSPSEPVTAVAAGSNLAFWIDDAAAVPDAGVLALPAISSLAHLQWTCFNRQAASDVWIDFFGSTSIVFPGEEFHPSLIILNPPADGIGATDPPPGRYVVPRHTPFPIRAVPAPCTSFRWWKVAGTGGCTLERPESEPENSILADGEVVVTPVFGPALRYLTCTWDAAAGWVDFAWQTFAPVDAIEVLRDGLVVAQLAGDAVAWRDTDPLEDEYTGYVLRPVCGGVAAEPACSCSVPPRPEIVLSSMEIDPFARVELGQDGTLSAHVSLRVVCSHLMQGYSFGLQYDEPTWRLERVLLLGEDFGFYWNYDLEPESAACAEPDAPGVVVGRAYDFMGPSVKESRIDLVFAIDMDSRRCCAMRFVDCLGVPPAQCVIVYGGTSLVSATHDGEACVSLPDTCGAIGDANADRRIDVADAVCILGYLFGASDDPGKLYLFLCPDSSDVNGDGRTDIADAIALLSRLFPG